MEKPPSFKNSPLSPASDRSIQIHAPKYKEGAEISRKTFVSTMRQPTPKLSSDLKSHISTMQNSGSMLRQSIKLINQQSDRPSNDDNNEGNLLITD
jgi:type II secretory pathway component PulF